MSLLRPFHTRVIALVFTGLLLSACEVNEPSESAVPNLVTGIVSAPNADSLRFSSAGTFADPFSQLAGWLTGTANAAVTGLVPVSGATVQLVRLDGQGNMVSVIATTTSAANGSYSFNDTPVPDSTLAVRVTGQSGTMRAIVTGAEINLSPASEAVVDSIVQSLGGGVTLSNFAVEEVSVLASLVAGLDVDLDGLTFAEAVAAIRNASAPVLGTLIAGFSSSGVEGVLHNNLYGGLQFETELKDPFTLGSGEGGIENHALGGGWGYGDGGATSGSLLFGTRTRHDLTSVHDPENDVGGVEGASHVVTAEGQVVVTDAAGNGSVGAVTSNGSLLIFPVETNASGGIGRGLMLAVKRSVDTLALNNTVLDSSGGGETFYNLVRLKETFSSPLSGGGENLAALTTENGSMSFDSDDQFIAGENVYAAFSADVTSTDRLALDLDSDTVVQDSPTVGSFNGIYQVIMDGSLVMQNSSGNFLGQGFASSDGRLLVLSTATDLMQIELDVLANDSDPDLGDKLTITGTSLTQLGGTVTVNAAGNKLLYTPPRNTLGTEVFTYTVSDGTTTKTGNVSFVLDNTNSPPVAVDDSGLSVAMGSVNNLLNVLANDSDPDLGDAVTISAVGTPDQGGTASVNGTGTVLLYTPAAGHSGNESFSYTITDALGLTATATVTVTTISTGNNSAPTAVDDTGLSVGKDSLNNPINVLANDSDPDIGDTLTVTAAGTVQAPTAGGTVTANGGNLLYTPAPGYTGNESFSYTISDGVDTDTATVTITVVAAGNTPPAAVDDGGISVAMDSSNNTLNVLANDSDPDIGDALTITAVGTPTPSGTVTINGGNSLRFTPTPGFSGTVAFDYTISDGIATDSATVTVTVLGVDNTAPKAEDDGGAGVEINVATGSSNNPLDVLANDHDDDVGDTLTVTAVSAVSGAAGGTVTINGAGPGNNLLYTPAAAGPASFTYTVSDGIATDTATVTLSVGGNVAPTAVADTFSVAENSSGNALAVLANDHDADIPAQTLAISAVGNPSANGGTVTINGATITYTPAANYSGADSFTYTVSDGAGGSNTASVTVTVRPANTAPVANNDSIAVTLDSSNNPLAVLANDRDADVVDVLIITQASITTPLAGGGTVNINGGNDGLIYTPATGATGTEVITYTISDGTATATATVTLTVGNSAPVAAADAYNVLTDSSGNTLDVLANDSDADAPLQTLVISAADATSAQGGTITNNGVSLTYTPAPAFAGSDSFGYTVSDGVTTALATVTVTVGANAAPAPVDDAFTVSVNSSGNALDVLSNDGDPDVPAQPLTITAASITTPLGAGGSVTINGTNDGLVYTPAAGATGTEVIGYTVSDGTLTADATVTVTVAANTAPSAVNDSFSVGRDSTGNTLNVLGNDSDPDAGDTLTISAVGSASNGGSVTNNGTSLNYTPAAGYTGSETFTYTVSDGTGTDTATVTMTVIAPINTAPVANDDDNSTNFTGFSVAMGSSGNPLDVLANDSDPDVGQTLAITAVGTPAPSGSVTINGGSSLLFTPAPGFSGNASFTYTVSDGSGGTDTATVTVTVIGIGNTTPDAVDDSGINVATNSSGHTLNVLANDSDPDLGDTLTITAVGAASNGGTVTNNGTSLGYTPASAFSGTETFTYTVSDGAGATDTATVTVTVGGNVAPTAVDDSGLSVSENSLNNILEVLANDSDADLPAQTLTITGVGATSAGGLVTPNGNNLIYTPAVGYSGTESFTYTVSDGNGGTDTATVTVTVVGANTAPNAVNDPGFNVRQNSSGNVLNVLANDSDPDIGDTLTITAVGATSNGGTVTNNGTSLSYAPAAAYLGPESFTYTVSDGMATATATVTVTVVTGNTAPLAVNDGGFNVGMGSISNPLDVLANDSDPDVGDTLTITAVGATSNGGTVTNNGTSLSYSPASGFNGSESFGYTISDGVATATATVTVNVIAANTPPTATGDTLSVRVNSSGNVLNVLANDSDPDVGDTLTITAVGAASNGGTVTNNGTSLGYTPASGYTGNETFSYTITDGKVTATAAVTVNVTAGNTAPAVADDTNWHVIMPTGDVLATNLANREIGVAIRRASGAGNGTVSGRYNVVQHAGYLTGGAATIGVGYQFGSLTFNGSGGISAGSLLVKRATLDIDAARSGTAVAVNTVPTATQNSGSGSYSVASNGTMTLSLNTGGAIVTGSGAVSADGELVALTIRVTEGGNDTGRGLLFLVRQP
ncbi:MAG: tandem-95 repeat protein [Gammaproteobacteria bacterium]|nr:tandem-95 repeat protein [Gammaproteobacteria bacterium]